MNYESELRQLWQKVKEMRHAQKTYFKTRSGDSLQASKNLEREVDKMITRLEGELGEQRTLF